MKPVVQTETLNGGNCFAACVASIFECRVQDVFDPSPCWVEGDIEGGWRGVQSWLNERGCRALPFGVDDDTGKRPTGFWIAFTGVDSSYPLHCTVWKDEDFIWNPFPDSPMDGTDLGELEAIIVFQLTDPSKFAKSILSPLLQEALNES